MLTDTLKTNAKAFRNPVKFCRYISSLDIFILTLEGECKIMIFSGKCDFINEIKPENTMKEA